MYELSYLDIYNKDINEVKEYIDNLLIQLEEEKTRYSDDPSIIENINDVKMKLKTTFNVRLNIPNVDINIINIDYISNLIRISKELDLPFGLFISGTSYYDENPVNNIPLLFTDEIIEQFEMINNYLIESTGLELRFSEEAYSFDNSWSLEDIITANDSVNMMVDYINKKKLTPFEAIAFIHKLVCSTFEYNEASEESSNARSLVGILCTDEIVCVGFAIYVKAVCNKLNMDGLICENYTCFIEKENDMCDELKELGLKSGEAHMQNLIRIDDEKYDVRGSYVLDTCWDSKNKNFPNGKGYANFMYPVTDLLCIKDATFIQHENPLDDVFCMMLDCEDKHEEAPIIVNNKEDSMPISIEVLYNCLVNLYTKLYTKSSEEETLLSELSSLKSEEKSPSEFSEEVLLSVLSSLELLLVAGLLSLLVIDELGIDEFSSPLSSSEGISED